MKYMVSFYYGRAGIAVVDVPRQDLNPEYMEDVASAEEVIIQAAVELGLNVTYPERDVILAFHDDESDRDYLLPEEVDEFLEFLANYELYYYEGLDVFVQQTGFEIKPMPPNTRVGIVEYGSKPKFNRLGVGRT